MNLTASLPFLNLVHTITLNLKTYRVQYKFEKYPLHNRTAPRLPTLEHSKAVDGNKKGGYLLVLLLHSREFFRKLSFVRNRDQSLKQMLANYRSNGLANIS